MTDYGITYYINGVTEDKNYTRGSTTLGTARVSESIFEQSGINSLPTLKLTIAGFTTVDASASGNLWKSKIIYMFSGSNFNTTDKLVCKYIIKRVVPKTDGYLGLEATASVGASGSAQLNDLPADSEQEGVNENLSGNLDNILGMILNETGIGLDTSGVSNKNKTTSLNIPAASWNKVEAINQLAKQYGYEYEVKYE